MSIIRDLAKTLIRGERAIIFPLQINNGWVSDKQGHHLMDIRGWGFIQYLPGEGVAEKFQDDFGDWVVKTLNEAYEKENN